MRRFLIWLSRIGDPALQWKNLDAAKADAVIASTKRGCIEDELRLRHGLFALDYLQNETKYRKEAQP